MGQGSQVIVLGAGAGGGSPQWNCNCELCHRARTGDPAVPRRRQTALAVSADGQRWVLVNAPPEMGEHFLEVEALHPQKEGRHSPVKAVALTGGEIDQVAGLLTMREGHAFSLYSSSAIQETLSKSAIFDALKEDMVPRRRLVVDEEIALCDADDDELGIVLKAFVVPGKIPLYEEQSGEVPKLEAESETNVAFDLQVGDQRVVMVPGCARITDKLKERVEGADILFFDGTLFRDEEMVEAGLSDKTGRRMGHVSVADPGGPLQEFSDVSIGRKILIHINNTNPILAADSEERTQVERAGWEVAYDGMEC